VGFAKNISDIFKKFLNGQDKRKILENSIIVIIIGVILIVAGGTIFTKNVDIYSSTNKQDNFNLEPSERNVVNSNDSVEVSNSVSKNSLEERMEKILSQIEGVGKVSVMITYEAGTERVPAYDKSERRNETQEEDNNGGKRTITQNDLESKVVYEEQNGTKKPIILKEIEPIVKGVVVVAEGGGDPTVKENLVKAVQALVDIAPHKVQVFEKGDS